MLLIREADAILLSPEHLYKERCWKTSEVLADHLLAQTLARDEELGCSSRSAVEELTSVKVLDTALRISTQTWAARSSNSRSRGSSKGGTPFRTSSPCTPLPMKLVAR